MDLVTRVSRSRHGHRRAAALRRGRGAPRLGEMVRDPSRRARGAPRQVIEVCRGPCGDPGLRGDAGDQSRPSRGRSSRARWPGCRVSRQMLGRIFSGLGEADRRSAGRRFPRRSCRSPAAPINPVCRERPSEFIETGISAIDGLNTPGARPEAADLLGRRASRPTSSRPRSSARRAVLTGEPFAVVFAAMGITLPRGRLLSRAVRGLGRARADRGLPQPGRRPHDRAPADAALRPDRGRVPGLRRTACTCSWS